MQQKNINIPICSFHSPFLPRPRAWDQINSNLLEIVLSTGSYYFVDFKVTLIFFSPCCTNSLRHREIQTHPKTHPDICLSCLMFVFLTVWKLIKRCWFQSVFSKFLKYLNNFYTLFLFPLSLFVIRLIMWGAPLLIPMKENLKRGISASRRLFCPVSDVLKGLIYHIV